ncbi:MAG: hypothetical protein H8E12_15395 [Rhodobacteraceae bacterium]|nr:hypothetical protein [Paracoccaceae bacterium]
MKLKTACQIGKDVGLPTIGESVDHIDHMSMSIFKYDEIGTELSEMYNDPLWETLNLSRADSVDKILT